MKTLSKIVDISFIIPFYNGSAYVEQLVQSIKSAYQFCATFSIEIVVIIDSVETNENYLHLQLLNILDDLIPIKLHKNVINQGVAASRNTGIALAAGTYFVIIDQDDLISTDYFACIDSELLFQFDFFLCNGKYLFEQTNKQINLFYINPTISLKNIILKDIIRSPGQVILKRQYYQDLLFPVPKVCTGADDKFFWIKLFTQYPAIKIKYLPFKMYVARLHNKNVSNDFTKLYFSALELWNIILAMPEFSLLKENKAVKRSVLFYTYKTKTYTNRVQKLLGFFEVFIYNSQLNKVIVFLLKKI